MSLIPSRIVKSIFLKIPNCRLCKSVSNEYKIIFEFNYDIIAIPKKGITVDHLSHILEYQFEMSWWMIDYIYGENGIR